MPGHCDPTVDHYDWYVGVRDGRVESLWPIAARGGMHWAASSFAQGSPLVACNGGANGCLTSIHLLAPDLGASRYGL